jgi:hypothetical protein
LIFCRDVDLIVCPRLYFVCLLECIIDELIVCDNCSLFETKSYVVDGDESERDEWRQRERTKVGNENFGTDENKRFIRNERQREAQCINRQTNETRRRRKKKK